MMDTTNLKVGDRVGTGGGGFHHGVYQIRKVVRRTATQVTLDDGTRWNQRGRRVGDGGSYYRDFMVTEQEANEHNEEERKRAERSALVKSVRDIEFRNISDDGLRMILTLAKDHTL